MARKTADLHNRERGALFAKRLKTERERLHLSQSDLSLRTGIPLDTIRSIENGRIVMPGIFTAADLVYGLSGSIDSWLNGSKQAKQKI